MGGRDHAGKGPVIMFESLPMAFQSFITFMDALKLRLRAKDQLHPLLQELVTGYSRFKGSKDWEGRSKMVSWYLILHSQIQNDNMSSRLITLNGMKVSEEISEEQSRQVSSLFLSARLFHWAYSIFIAHVRCRACVRRVLPIPQWWQRRQ
jgi:hypothetical protein